jgi:hypothetical protein
LKPREATTSAGSTSDPNSSSKTPSDETQAGQKPLRLLTR